MSLSPAGWTIVMALVGITMTIVMTIVQATP